MVNRRKFLRYVFMGTGAVSAAYIAKKTGTLTFEHAVRRILNHDLQGLRVRYEDILSYAKEISKNKSPRFHFAAVQLVCLYDMNPLNSVSLPFREKYNSLRTEIVSGFLFSTDFFYNGMNEEKEITFTGTPFNPYTTPCANPFSGLFYKNTTAGISA